MKIEIELSELSIDTRRDIAFETSCLEALVELARDESDQVRTAAATNINTPKEELRELSKDDTFQVIEAVAANPNTPKDILIIFSKDERDDLRISVASNPSTPKRTLKNLLNDDNDLVSSAAKETLKELDSETT